MVVRRYGIDYHVNVVNNSIAEIYLQVIYVWPFDLFDDSPDWVKARRKRFKLIENMVIDNVPDILLMSEGYSFMYHKSMNIESYAEHGRINYFLGIQRFGGVGDACGICLGYYIIEEIPDNYSYDYKRMRISKDFEYFFQGNELDIWKNKLAEQLPDFFKCCREDIKQKLTDEDHKNTEVKRQCKSSIDNTSNIIDCLKLKLGNS